MKLPAQRGRATALAAKFSVTPNAAKKWLDGIGMPELSKAIEIADEANVSVTWLLQGAGPKKAMPRTPLAQVVGQAIEILGPADGAEVADFVRFKLGRATPSIEAREPIAEYLAALDSLRTTTRHP